MEKVKIAAIIYGDDTDLIHINLETMECMEDAHDALQSAISSWGNLLLASRGSLKPEKCFAYLIDFEWLPDGSWKYVDSTQSPEFEIKIHLANGRTAPID